MHFIKRIITGTVLVILLLLVSGSLKGQTYLFRNVNQRSGLCDLMVNCLHQDGSGYLWAGTDNGLSRFDGLAFKNYRKGDGLPDNFINTIFGDNENNLWVAVEGNGVHRFNLGSGTFDAPVDVEQLKSKRVHEILRDHNGHYWFATANGVSRYDGAVVIRYTMAEGLTSDFIRKIKQDRLKRVWAGALKGISYFDGKRFVSPKWLSPLKDELIIGIQEDAGGNLYVGTRNRGVFYLDIAAETIRGLPETRRIKAINTIFFESDGGLWMGTEMNGVYYLNENRLSHYDTANGLPGNNVSGILKDREGQIWFATDKGISCLYSLNVKCYVPRDGFPGGLLTITREPNGGLWFGGKNGLSYFSNGRLKYYSAKDGWNPDIKINRILVDDKRNVWIATPYDGIFVLNRRTGGFKNFGLKEGLLSPTVLEITRDRNGTIYAGTVGGLCRYEKGRFIPMFPKEDLTTIISILHGADGGMWFSAMDRLFRFHNGNLRELHRVKEMLGGIFMRINRDKRGRVWICSTDGLGCLDKGKLRVYTTKDGLPDNSCCFVLEDRERTLWIGTKNGLSSFDGKQFKTFTSRNSLLGTGSWETGLEAPDGTLWFGGSEGIAAFKAPPFKSSHVPPPIYLTNVKVRGNPIVIEQNHRFSHTENYIRFDFVGLSYRWPEKVTYRYRLEGIDDNWQQTGDRSVLYPYLPPREYRFRVKAVNSDGTASTATAQFAFEITPPYWDRWWFQTLILILLLCSLLFINYWRSRRVEEKTLMRGQKRELEIKNRQLIMAQRMELMGTLATGTVHDLKNLLSIILGYSQMAEEDQQDAPQPGSHQLDTITIIKDTAETAVKMSKQILSFSQVKDEDPDQLNLVHNLNEAIATLKLSTPKHISTIWRPPAEPIMYAIHPGRFQQVVMNLYMNALQAIPLAGEVAEITVTIDENENGHIILTVSDTGFGMNQTVIDNIFQPLFTTKTDGKGTGLGLYVVKQIVDEHNGTITVNSEPGKGTTFTVTF